MKAMLCGGPRNGTAIEMAALPPAFSVPVSSSVGAWPACYRLLVAIDDVGIYEHDADEVPAWSAAHGIGSQVIERIRAMRGAR